MEWFFVGRFESMGFGYDEIELLVLSCRALLAVSDVPVVCERPTPPP